MLSSTDLLKMRSQQEEALPSLMNVTRPTGTTSSIGSRTSGTPIPIHTAVPCRITPNQMNVTLGQQSRPIDIHTYTVRCPRWVDVDERDFVEVDGITYEVERVKRLRSWETVQTFDCKVVE